jgi:hypothetical protein
LAASLAAALAAAGLAAASVGRTVFGYTRAAFCAAPAAVLALFPMQVQAIAQQENILHNRKTITRIAVQINILEAEAALHEFDISTKWGPRLSVTRLERLARLRKFTDVAG